MKALIATAALLGSPALHAADKFPIGWEAAFAAAELADMATTSSIKHVKGGTETNHVLGREPEDGTCAIYGVAVIALHVGVTYVLISNNAPRWLVTTWEASTVGYEVATAARNYRLGYHFKF